jgi:hypothetical protein
MRPHPAALDELLWPEDQYERDTAVTWLVPDLLRPGAVGCVFGLPGTHKSYLMLHLAVCLANGVGEFLGKPITEHGSVLVIAADDGADTTIDRLRQIAAFELGTDVRYTGIVMADRGWFTLADGEEKLGLALALIRERFDIPPRFVLIDTASMAGAPTEDWGNSYPARLGWLKMFAGRENCCVVLTDHTAKGDIHEQDVRVGMWGSAIKAGFFEFAWSLKSTNDGTLLQVSDKRSPVRPTFTLRFGDNGYSLEFDDGPAGLRVEDDILTAVVNAGTAVTIADLAKEVSLGEQSVRRKMKHLLTVKKVVEIQPASGTRPATYGPASTTQG